MANPRYNTQTTNPRQKLASGGRAKAMGGGVMRRDMASGYYPSDMGMSGGAMMKKGGRVKNCLLYTSPSPRDRQKSRMPSSA